MMELYTGIRGLGLVGGSCYNGYSVQSWGGRVRAFFSCIERAVSSGPSKSASRVVNELH